MKTVVTGGAGFIGSNYIRYVLENDPDARILCIDKLTYAANEDTLFRFYGDPRFEFVRADIADREAIYEIFEKHRPVSVVNFAAETHVDRSIEDPSVFTVTNVLGTEVLMDASLKYGVKRFHQVSTDEVYGDLPLCEGDPFTEDSPLMPSSPYSASKAAADLLVLSYVRTFGLCATVSRSSNNYGAFQHPEKLIPTIVLNALEKRSIPIYGDGRNVRDWIYVDDHVRAIDLVLKTGKNGEIYNVGGGYEMSNLDTVSTVLEKTGISDAILEFVPDRKGHDRRYSMSCEKIKRELGFVPTESFDAGIEKTVKWYMDNTSWWKKLNG